MSAPIFDPIAPTHIPIMGEEDSFAVANIYGVTRNYDPDGTLRARPERPAPAIFTKSAQWVVGSGATIPYPAATNRLEPEIELVIAIGSPAFRIGGKEAAAAIYGYGVGLDLTRRDLQHAAREKRDPLDIAKWFPGASPLSIIVRTADINSPDHGAITLDVNGARVQEGDLNQLIWKPPEIVALLSQFFPLVPGDIIYTGTPPGEVALKPGDVLHGKIDGIGMLDITIGKAP
jgi:fumarylpyruvate hydrolase